MLANIEVSDVFAGLSLLLSLALGLFYLRDREHPKYAIETGYTEALLAWHGRVVELLVKFRHLDRPGSDPGHCEDVAMLSALIEQGRFFFPNINKNDGFGIEKPHAYRGYRNLALEFLVSSYDMVVEGTSRDFGAELEALQRYFTSIVFEVVRPAARLQRIKRLTDRYFQKDYSAEDFFRLQ